MSNLSAYDFFSNNYFDNDTFIEQFSKCQNIDLAKFDVNEGVEDTNIIKVLPAREYKQKLLSEFEKRLGYAPNDSAFSTIREWDKYHKEYGWTPRQYAEWAEPEEELREYVRELIYAYEDILGHWNNIMGESLKEDTVKQGNGWVNKGKEGAHGKFKTKKGADAQRRAMFANGYKESMNMKKRMNEDFRAQVDWTRLEYELWEVLEEKLGAGAEVYFGEVQAVSSNQSGVTYEALWGDEDAGEEVTTIKGKMFGTPSKITMTMHIPNQNGTDEVEVYDVGEMADALIKFGNR